VSAKKNNCPICGSSLVVLKDSYLGVYGCGNCSHTFTLIRKQGEKSYDRTYFEEEHKNWFKYGDPGLYDFVYRKLWSLLEGKRFRLLDVGCGNGDFLKRVRRKDSEAELCGIDLVGNKGSGIEFIKGDFFKENFGGKKFNAICNFDVAEHINNPDLFARKLNAVLEPGGFLVVKTVDNNGLVYMIARALKFFGIRTAFDRVYSIHHLQHYSKKSLKAMLEKNGFKVLLQKSRNCPLKSVDVPKGNFVTENVYRFLVGVVFLLSNAFGNGMYQAVFCKKASKARK